MRITIKIALAMILAAAIAVAILSLFAVRQESVLIERDMERDARLVADSLAAALQLQAVGLERQNSKRLLEAVERAERDLRITWIEAGDDLDALLPPGVSAQGSTSAKRGSWFFHDRDASGVERVHAVAPVHRGQHLIGAVHVAEQLSSRDAFIDRSLRTTALTILAVTLLSGMLAMLLGRYLVGSRVDELVAKARRIAAGDFSRPLVARGRDELSDLMGELNRMSTQLERARLLAANEVAARLEAEANLRHADRLVTVGQLAAGVAHELGTPLNVVLGRASLIADEDSASAEARRNASKIRDQVTRMVTIVRQLLDFARRRSPEFAATHIGDVVQSCLDMLGATFKKAGVQVEVSSDQGSKLSAWSDVGQLQQLLMNLLLNACQAMPDGGRVHVRLGADLCSGPPSSKPLVVIEIEDEGAGIEDEVLSQIFDPFFTTKEPGKGTGLGLSVVHGIVRDHGGHLLVEGRPGRGALFRVELPAEAPR